MTVSFRRESIAAAVLPKGASPYSSLAATCRLLAQHATWTCVCHASIHGQMHLAAKQHTTCTWLSNSIQHGRVCHVSRQHGPVCHVSRQHGPVCHASIHGQHRRVCYISDEHAAPTCAGGEPSAARTTRRAHAAHRDAGRPGLPTDSRSITCLVPCSTLALFSTCAASALMSCATLARARPSVAAALCSTCAATRDIIISTITVMIASSALSVRAAWRDGADHSRASIAAG